MAVHWPFLLYEEGKMSVNKIALGCDNVGFDLKEQIKKYLIEEKNYEGVIDPVQKQEEGYLAGIRVAEEMCVGIQKDVCRLGLYICGTGLGFSTMANKYWGIRAAHASDCYTAQRARQSLNAQILCIGSRVLPFEYAKMVIDAFLDKPFDFARQSSVENLQMFKEHEEKILGREKPDYVAWSMGYYEDGKEDE